MCAGMGSFVLPGASSFLSSLKESYQRKPLETTFQDFLGAGMCRCCACGRKLGRFVPRHEYLSFFVKRKVPKKTTQTYGLRIPWRGAGKCKFGGAGFAELERRGTLSVRGIACTACAAAADAVRVGGLVRWSSGDYQIAPIAARSTAMGRWRLTPPGYWGDTACGRRMGRFVPRHE